ALLMSVSVLLLLLGLSLGAMSAFAADSPPPQPDPSGIQLGSGADLAGIAPGTLTTDDFDAAAETEPFALTLADMVHQNRLGIDWGMIGWKGFFLSDGTYDVGVVVMFLFQMVFMDTTATIPTGAMAERWKWSAFCVYGFFISTIVYPIFGNWAWGGGWLSQLG